MTAGAPAEDLRERKLGSIMKILIVDDEPTNINLLAHALKNSYEIITASNGFDAISLVKEQSPDLVLLDVMMPEMDGFQVCRLLRAEGACAETPVIFVTAVDSQEGELEGLELGAVDYITKPINLKLAKLRIRNQLELKRQRDIVKEQNVLLTRQQTALREAEQLARHLALFDALTDLPNRRMLLDRLTSGLSQAKRFHRSLAVMFLDLDRFKEINDTFGHEVGDRLLKEVARRLTTCVRSGDTVSRSGGDEFVIVLPEIAHSTDAKLVAEKIIQTFGEPVRIDERLLNVTTSIGIAVYPINGSDDANELMKKADRAMYVAKKAGRNRYQIFAETAKTVS